jgi:chromosome segregation ATPase
MECRRLHGLFLDGKHPEACVLQLRLLAPDAALTAACSCRMALTWHLWRNAMKNSAVVIGMLVAVGIAAGAFIMSSTGRVNPAEHNPQSAAAGMDSLAREVEALGREVGDLKERLERNSLMVEENARSIRELRDRLAAAGERPEMTAAKDEPAKALDSGNPEVIEDIKEAVKREIKEEEQVAQQEKTARAVSQWKQKKEARWRGNLDNRFSGLAEKLGLDVTQEMAVREIAEQTFEKIMALLDNTPDKSATDGQWGEFKGEFERVYQEAESQLERHVNDKQRQVIMDFLRSGAPGK